MVVLVEIAMPGAALNPRKDAFVLSLSATIDWIVLVAVVMSVVHICH